METIVNARSETVFQKSAFERTGRAVVPADGWYEWTGQKRRKTAWRITSKDNSVLWFAAITDLWTGPGGVSLLQVATVTCPPSDDVAELHDRMGVILPAEKINQWLQGDKVDLDALMRPWPAGRLQVEKATGVDWSGS